MTKLMLPAILIFMSAVSVFTQIPPIEPGVSLELAKWRAARYSDVRYKLNLTLEKMSPVLKGTIEIRVNYAVTTETEPTPRFIVFDWRKIKGSENRSAISNVSINGRAAIPSKSDGFSRSSEETPKGVTLTYAERDDHLVFTDGVVAGENVIKLDFTSPILPSGSAVTRYVDKEDGAEYIYSLFVPSDASTAFPVFDQPDLKVRFDLHITAPNDWKLVSNTNVSTYLQRNCGQPSKINIDTGKGIEVLPYQGCNPGTSFAETKPISTYIFAFAAGPFERVSEPGAIATGYGGGQAIIGKESTPPGLGAGGDAASSRHPVATAPGSDIYVRRSQLAKFKPHAAEVFRLNREAVKYFEEYFDYKFPFPKYDLVLIPEFPFGGMEHAGATFLRESAVIFPQEPTRNDHISRATLIFHEAAHQWFGDTVTMRWFDDLWLKEGFATFTAYKALERIMPEMNAWKVFFERVKQAAYQTDSTRGTTPIYQEIKNLSAAKSAYGAIVYNKAPAFLRQAEFYLGEDKFRAAVRAFLKKHEFRNAGWEELVKEFVTLDGEYAGFFASQWVRQRGLPKFTYAFYAQHPNAFLEQSNALGEPSTWWTEFNVMTLTKDPGTGMYGKRVVRVGTVPGRKTRGLSFWENADRKKKIENPDVVFPNYQDFGYGIFLLNPQSREYVLKNIQNEKDPFLRAMMWGSLWDSVREGELDPRAYVELVVKVLSKSDGFSRSSGETPKGVTLTEDESTTALLLSRTGTALNYYVDDTGDLRTRVEDLLIERMRNAGTVGRRITFYRALLNVASSERARKVLKDMLQAEPPASAGGENSTHRRAGESPKSSAASSPPAYAGGSALLLKTKDKFDIVTRLLVLGDPEAERLLAALEKTETSDDAKRYAYAARAGIGTAENKAKYWKDFTENKEISESWIEAAFGPWNSIRHSDLTLPYLERALRELPNHKRNRKIFFVNGWLGAFIGGQRSEQALAVVNKFLADNPKLDNDLRLKILENLDVIERAVRIRSKYAPRRS